MHGLPSAVESRTFGEFTVLLDGVPADVGGPKQRLLLAHLLCRANSVVPVKELIDALWAGRPPRTALKSLQVYVSKLRRVFGARLDYAGRGYRLCAGPDECDLLRFEFLARQGRHRLRDGDPEAAAVVYGQAVALWREPLAEFGDEPGLAPELGRWQQLFLATLEDWAELAVESGDHQTVLARLAPHIRPHVLRERLGAAWIQALAAAGRVPEALAHYEFVRRMLADELGVDPGPALARVHRRLLTGVPQPSTRPDRNVPGNQLPRDLPDFIGRTTETAQVLASLTIHKGHRIIVAHGCGTSAFAIHVGHLLYESYSDGQLLLDLAATDGTAKPDAQVFAELMDMIGLDGTAQAAARWRSWITRRRLLVILDNATHEDIVRALLPGAGSSAVIVAGRSRLSGLESVQRVRLGPLGDAESRELLGRVIGSSRILADRDSVRRILDSCGGSPLALRIAGAKLAALRHITLADFADRLADPRRVLDELAVGELTLRERHDVAYRSLSGLQRAAYRRIAALPPPPFDHGQLLAAMTGLSTSDYVVLESLLECGLLSAPEAEVTACYASYDMPVFTYWHCHEMAAQEDGNVSHSGCAESP
ncbi:BTAD domain-containing putative transcriptional regulator [Actinocrispum sp. NPDC049592]|uniref:AfsR/SARP family transcriptional regulator n=1 Tax=Actinocrispum sp. NPDC049592 TaxID=3154835 RepID=UPI00342604C7